MANFRIDELNIDYNGTSNNYTVSGTCNSNDTHAYPQVQGEFSVANRQISFNTSSINADHKIEFNCTTADFSDFDGRDMVFLVFGDKDQRDARKVKGGVVVVDTEYPPPTGVTESLMELTDVGIHHRVSGQFRIRQIKFVRVHDNQGNFTDNFTISIITEYQSNTTRYTANPAEFKTDPLNAACDVVVLNVFENKDDLPHSGYLTFNVSGSNAKPLELKNYRLDGLPVVIKDNNTAWPDVRSKKVLACIL